MARELIPYYNASADGYGMEGLLSFSNRITDYWMLPIFLLVFYALAIHVSMRSGFKTGGSIMYVSFVFFLLGMVAQTFTQFNQLVIFIFFVGMIVGAVMSYIENAKS